MCIHSEVNDISTSLLALKFKSVHLVRGSKYLDLHLLATIDPEVVIESKLRDVAVVIKKCFWLLMYY